MPPRKQHRTKAREDNAGGAAAAAEARLDVKQEDEAKEGAASPSRHGDRKDAQRGKDVGTAQNAADKGTCEVLAPVEYLGEGCTLGQELGKLDLAKYDGYT